MGPDVTSHIPSPEFPPSRFEADKRFGGFVELIERGDGTLIPLLKRSKLNELFLVSTRIGRNEKPKPYKLLLVDLFAESPQGNIKAVGHYDWEMAVAGVMANGNKDRHTLLPCPEPAHQIADRTWCLGNGVDVCTDTPETLVHRFTNGRRFAPEHLEVAMSKQEVIESGLVRSDEDWTKEIYGRQGLGSLLVIASAAALRYHGILEMDLGRLSHFAAGLWKKFGVEGKDGTFLAEPGQVLSHPHAQATVQRFLTEG